MPFLSTKIYMNRQMALIKRLTNNKYTLKNTAFSTIVLILKQF